MAARTPAAPQWSPAAARHRREGEDRPGRRRKYALLIALILAVHFGLPHVPWYIPWSVPRQRERSWDCHFAQGFARLRAQLGPATTGFCLGDESFDPGAGVAVQPTARGLLVWRKADSGTAFSDGHLTWIAGPFGLQQRLNTERFCWEADAAAGRCLQADEGKNAGRVVPFEQEVAALAGALTETLLLRAESEWSGWWERVTLWVARALSA